MQDLVSLAVLFGSLLHGTRGSNVDTMNFLKLRGRLFATGYLRQTIIAKSRLACIRHLCSNSLVHCAVSYNRYDHRCVRAPISGYLINWDPNKFTVIDGDPNWASYITAVSKAIDRPSLLYLLDNVSKGKNLGGKDSQLDLIETGLTAWNGESGPRGINSHLRYLISDKNNRAEIPYKKGDGSYLIDFLGNFTIAVWVKTDTRVKGHFPMIEGRPNLRLPDFCFYPSKDHDQLFLSPNYPHHVYKSTINGTGKEFWRHVAVVYKGFGDVEFYLNGSNIGLISGPANEATWKLPNTLKLGNAEQFLQFFGAMACVTIHEEALSKEEIKTLMEICP